MDIKKIFSNWIVKNVLLAVALLAFMNHASFAPQASKIRVKLTEQIANDIVPDPAVRQKIIADVSSMGPQTSDKPLSEKVNIDTRYLNKIRQDLSAVMVCMLRTQGIPARLMIGYADKQYHAWVEADVNGKECFFDPTAALSAISRVKEYTIERYY